MEVWGDKPKLAGTDSLTLANVVHLLNGAGDWGRLNRPGVVPEYSPDDARKANEIFTRTLRTCANRWIDSGKDSEGREEPLKRNLGGISREVANTLYEFLRNSLNRNKPEVVLGHKGEIAIFLARPDTRGLDAIGYANQCAAWWFLQLLDSGFAHYLARCANPECRKYYVRKRLRRMEIKRAAYCGRCAGIGSAARMKFSRASRKQKLVDMAAAIWNEWTKSESGGRSTWVAAKMNNRLPSAERITGKWVTQNGRLIKTKAWENQQGTRLPTGELLPPISGTSGNRFSRR